MEGYIVEIILLGNRIIRFNNNLDLCDSDEIFFSSSNPGNEKIFSVIFNHLIFLFRFFPKSSAKSSPYYSYFYLWIFYHMIQHEQIEVIFPLKVKIDAICGRA